MVNSPAAKGRGLHQIITHADSHLKENEATEQHGFLGVRSSRSPPHNWQRNISILMRHLQPIAAICHTAQHKLQSLHLS